MRHSRPGMGCANALTVQNKIRYHAYLKSFARYDRDAINQAVNAYFAQDAQVKISHPIHQTSGAKGYCENFINPLFDAFQGLQRQDYILIGGEYLGSQWVTSTGYFYGHFHKPLFGIPPSGNMAFLRYGEFLQIKNAQVVQAQCFLGLAELIIDLGLWPLQLSAGYEGVVLGPASLDGKQLEAPNPQTSADTGALVEDMLLRLTSDNQAWKPYWHDAMVWYGPGGFGSYATPDGFAAFQVPFEKTFQGWGDGQNEGVVGVGSSCKAGDGNYAFLCGWPQITGIHVKPFMGIPPTQKRIFMRDCDWWRVADGKILENWCMVDTLDVAMQLGRDVLGEISASATSRS